VATETPTATSDLIPDLQPVEIFDFDEGKSKSGDLIIFQSSSTTPFNNTAINDAGLYVYNSYEGVRWGSSSSPVPQLWGVSPDGKQAGLLSLPVTDFAAYFPTVSIEKPLVITKYLEMEADFYTSLPLPPECDGQLTDDEYEWLIDESSPPCSDFKFSTDGKYLAFFFGPQRCWRGIIILNTETGETIYRSTAGRGHSFEFLDNGYALVATGHCEGGVMDLINLQTGEETRLGDQGQLHWNHQSSAFVVAIHGYSGIGSKLLGFNSLTNQTIFATEWQEGINDQPVWAPPGTHILNERRPTISTDRERWTDIYGEQQIVKIDMTSGEEQIMAADPGYDFFLCSKKYAPCEWSGDWVQIRRLPFQFEDVALSWDWNREPEQYCLLYGEQCENPAELFWLNWQTGEIVPGAQIALPTPTPEPTQYTPGPDTNQAPIYTHPAGEYAFYIGNDNHSLWLVPPEGEPQLWVAEGQDFRYVSQVAFSARTITTPTPTPTPSTTLSATPSPIPSATPIPTLTSTPVPPTITFTATPSFTPSGPTPRPVTTMDSAVNMADFVYHARAQFEFSPVKPHVLYPGDYRVTVRELGTWKVIWERITDATYHPALFSGEGQYVATVVKEYGDYYLLFLDAATGEQTHKVAVQGLLRDMETSPAGDLFAYSNGQETLVFDMSMNQELFRVPGGDCGLAISVDNHLAVCDNTEKSASFWALPSGRRLGGIELATDPSEMRFSPDGRFLAYQEYQNSFSFLVFAAPNYHTVGGSNNITAFAFSPDGNFLATGNGEGLIQIWQLDPWQEIRRIYGHMAKVTWVTYASDGSYLLSHASDEATVRGWDLQTGFERVNVPVPDVVALALSPDNQYLLTMGANWTAWQWPSQAQPPTPTPDPLCGDVLPPRLVVGKAAWVDDTSSTPNRLRAAPSLSADHLSYALPGAELDVLDGPVCADGLWWWRVLILENNLVGWTVEGDANGYWLVPDS
jgi:WD40 repeat protein